jgi:hypothetical protein
MEGVGGLIYTILAVAAFFLIVLLLLLPVFVFQIANSSTRSEELLKKAIAELEKINAHLTPPLPPQE